MMDDDDLIAILKSERARAIGFDNDAELTSQRERGIEYYNGVMNDVPWQQNRSKAVSTDVADAIETLLPNLLDIFTGGDDVATFVARGPEDEDAAQQETDYVNFVIFQQNDGFTTLYTMIKDALQSKTGIVKYWWEDYDDETETFEGKTQMEGMALQQAAQQPNAIFTVEDVTAGDEPDTFDITIKKKVAGKLCIKPVPPEDFAVASDTVNLRDANYCAMRSRPRVQDLIARGIDRDKAEGLPPFGISAMNAVSLARDTVAENSLPVRDAAGDLRTVEVVEHFVRVLEGGKLKLYAVETGANESVVLSKREAQRVEFAGITPFPVTHRFHGQSVADLLMQLQQINTAVMRGFLDSIYFALNQRYEIAVNRSNEYTLSDVLNNQPGMPVRSKDGDAVKAIAAGGPNIDYLAGLEYLQTRVEQRTGIVRNAQGLNPDTLHDTAKGAIALMGAAQRRERLIARIFAETGIKDLFLGVHATLREHAEQPEIARLRGNWVPVDPSTWGERSDMSIEIGLGSGGKDQDLAAMMMQKDLLQQIVEAQGGPVGPVVTMDNLYAFAKRFMAKSGAKTPEAFVTDPKGQGPVPPPQGAKTGPDPQIEQGKLQLQQAELQQDGQKTQAELQLKGQQLQLEQQKLEMAESDRQHKMKMDAINAMGAQQLAEKKLDLDSSLKLAAINAQFKTSVTVATIKADAEAFRAHVDLTIQASEHDHAQSMQAADHEAQSAQQEAALKAQPAESDDG